MIGTLLSSRYRLDAELGHGGMGVVYRAHDTLLDRDVAVKVLSGSKLGTEGRARLLREAQAVAKLDHPNIVSVYDVGEAEGMPFVVMQLVEGQSLRDRPPQTLDEIRSPLPARATMPRSASLSRSELSGDCTISKNRFPETTIGCENCTG